MLSVKLQESKNATVSSYRALYGTVSKEDLLTALAEELLDQLTLKEQNEAVDKFTQSFTGNIKQAIENYPAQNVKKIVKLRVPVKYLSETAKEEDKKVFEMYKTIVDGIAEKGYGTIVFPAVRDDNGNPLFDLEVL